MDEEGFITIEPCANFGRWMPEYRFKEFRYFLPEQFVDYSRRSTDPWWRFIGGVEQFNMNRLNLVVASNHLTMDELMSAWRPRTTRTGGLPNITHIPRKPEPLGTEFKCVTCSKSNIMLHLELQRGREGMRDSEHHRELGATAACTVRLSEVCKQRNDLVDDDNTLVMKGDSWFGSVKAAANLAQRGIECILQIKTGHSFYPKAFVEDALKDAPGGVHIVLKGRHPNGHTLYAIGYCYLSKKTLFFIMTAGAGSTTPGEPYEMKFTDEHGNVGTY